MCRITLALAGVREIVPEFALAALVSPLVTIAGEDTALPLAITMLAAAVIALIGIITAGNSTREATRR